MLSYTLTISQAHILEKPLTGRTYTAVATVDGFHGERDNNPRETA